MKPLIELVSEWDTFATKRNETSVEAFCRYYLAKKTMSATKQDASNRITSNQGDDELRLSRTLGRVATIQRTLLKQTLKEKLDIEVEWYYFLHTINARKTTRKTDVISISLLSEPTTGIDILNRMIKAGLLTEQTDPSDKRARLLNITKEGKNLLQRADRLAQQIAALLFGNMDATEQEEMQRALSVIEKSFRKTVETN